MIKSIFFCKFDVHEGPRVVHQVPTNSITAPADHPVPPLVHFPSIQHLLIPRQNLCGLPLAIYSSPVRRRHHAAPTSRTAGSTTGSQAQVGNSPSLVPVVEEKTVSRLGAGGSGAATSSAVRILTLPMRLVHPSYPRNEFLFAIALVLPASLSHAAHAPVAAALAHRLAHLEREHRFLSEDASPPDSGPIFALCEILREDLNSYSESALPLRRFLRDPSIVPDATGRSHSHPTLTTDIDDILHLKLFPPRPPPPPRAALAPWLVPLATVRLAALADETWDLTLRRLLPWCDGIRSIREMARIADVDEALARKAIAHLVHYGCAIIIDRFRWSNTYAPTPELATLVDDEELLIQVKSYVLLPEENMPEWLLASSKDQNKSSLSKPVQKTLSNRQSSFVDDVNGNESSASSPISTRSQQDKSNSAIHEPPSTSVRNYRSGSGLIELYTSLHSGVTLQTWVQAHGGPLLLATLDVRRFIVFGLLHGFLYRVHSYAFSMQALLANTPRRPLVSTSGPSHNAADAGPGADADLEAELEAEAEALGEDVAAAWMLDDPPAGRANGLRNDKAAVHPGNDKTPLAVNQDVKPATNPVEHRNESLRNQQQDPEPDAKHRLARFLDGAHSFDEICATQSLTEQELRRQLRAWPDVQIIMR